MTKGPDELVREEIRRVTAYHVPPAQGMVKLDAMENPYRLPAELAREMGARLAQVAINRWITGSTLTINGGQFMD